ncbi:MAG: hypothetical protein IJ863_00135, partial [Spirochaetales bacterium]|nr:hypothetical protein [Spirochaetales bacterium]
GLISIMLDTQRRDLMSVISNVITDENDRRKAYEPYLLDPVSMVADTILPPIWQVTSAEDLIRNDSLKFSDALEISGAEHVLVDYPKGTERKLIHVFSVQFPMYPESREVLNSMDGFFKAYAE